MKVLVALEAHFLSRPGKGVFGLGPLNYSFWGRYLDVFGSVLVLARVAKQSIDYEGFSISSGPRVEFIELHDFYGPYEYWLNYFTIANTVKKVINEADAYILRVPGTIGWLAYKFLKKNNRSFALEVVGDPWESLGQNTVRSLTRPFARVFARLQLKKMCRDALAVSYVTNWTLQNRYPSRYPERAIGCSSIELEAKYILDRVPERILRFSDMPSLSKQKSDPFRIGFIGSFNVMYKAPDIHLLAISRCIQQGLNVVFLLVGDGKHRLEMENLAKKLGIERQVHFLGQLPPGEAIFGFLDTLDLYLIASLTEGLPRSLIEAMARGCPAIGTRVGGIPELLEERYLVEPGDPDALAAKIMEVYKDKSQLSLMAERNLRKAREYCREILSERRRSFYTNVKLLSSAHREHG